ncbi:MAG: helix-turn-helix transcriptional regulator [Defluviitaleaceae bacterium]|nr:helix-turn-helix transcriptional regulator [Defluviitaleaceae bacterium]
MAATIGQTIRKLRKERNFTQEELAEQLNVTYQAVSKWETGLGMPDISQIVPLASVFGVSTDVLFGTYGASDDENVDKVIESANALKGGFLTTETAKRIYEILQDGLSQYPNNTKLLMETLNAGLYLAYPDELKRSYPEYHTYDETIAKDVYRECVRIAGLVISYGKDITDILRAHNVMVLLHTAHGDMSAAWAHANRFPWRCDMTSHVMAAYIRHVERDYEKEATHCQEDIMLHFEAMLCSIAQLGDSYRYLGKYDEAIKIFNTIFTLIGDMFAEETFKPPTHLRERGDVHALIAHTYLDMKNTAAALDWLEKMVDYDLTLISKYKNELNVKSPILKDMGYDFYFTWEQNDVIKQRLLKKLANSEFDALKTDKGYKILLERVNAVN